VAWLIAYCWTRRRSSGRRRIASRRPAPARSNSPPPDLPDAPREHRTVTRLAEARRRRPDSTPPRQPAAHSISAQ
jgi:hypothetical protein